MPNEFEKSKIEISKDDSTIVVFITYESRIICYNFETGQICYEYNSDDVDDNNDTININDFFILSQDGREIIISEYSRLKKIKFSNNDMSYTEQKVDHLFLIEHLVYNKKDNYFYSINRSTFNTNKRFLTRWDVETLTVQFESPVLDVFNIIGFIENFIVCIIVNDSKKSKIGMFNLDSNHDLNDIYNFVDITVENMYIYFYGKAVQIINNNLFVPFYQMERTNKSLFSYSDFLYQFFITEKQVKNAAKKK